MKTNINIFNIPDTLQLEELLDVKGGTGDNNKLCAVIGEGVKCTVAPHSILWMLNTACVTNCKYCYADRNTPYRPLSTSQILKIIEELHNLKVQYVDVIGGEIFLKKDWEVIIAKLVEYGMSPTYISTKMPITHNLAEKLKQTGYRNVVQLSIDSLCDETLHDIIGANKGYAEQMKESAVILQEYNFPIQIDTILTKHNANPKEIKFLYDFIKRIKGLTTWEIRVPEWSLYTPETFKNIQASKSSLQSILDHIKHEIISNAEINITLSSEALEENFRSDGPEKQCFKGGTCGILQNRCFVLPDGKVSVCEQMYWHKEFVIGDLTKQSMEEIWNSDKAIEIFDTTAGRFRKESRCSSCKFFDGCNRDKRRCVVKVVKAYGLANWDYPDPRCVYAPEIQTGLKY